MSDPDIDRIYDEHGRRVAKIHEDHRKWMAKEMRKMIPFFVVGLLVLAVGLWIVAGAMAKLIRASAPDFVERLEAQERGDS